MARNMSRCTRTASLRVTLCKRVASNVLGALGVPVPEFGLDGGTPDQRPGTAAYWREYVLPWIGRRLRGTSSGDSREPKSATLQPVTF